MEAPVSKFKVLIIGDSSVGKTSLLLRHVEGKFAEERAGTIGVDYRANTYIRDGARYDLQMWDTAGQERFRNVTIAYYRDAHAALIVFDLSNPVSFQNLPAWYEQFKDQTGRPPNELVTILVGNKSDIVPHKVTLSEILAMVSELGITSYIQTSAKDGSKVDEVFEQLLEKILMNYSTDTHTHSIKLRATDTRKQKTCC